MIREVTHFTQPCPVCGRPLHIYNDYLGCLVTCQHCRGQFVAENPDFDVRREHRPFTQRADQLSTISGHCVGSTCGQPSQHPDEKADSPFSVLCAGDIRRSGHLTRKRSPSCYLAIREAQDMPTVLLVEHRDDFFAQLAGALANGGVRTTRVKYATQAIRQYVEGSTDLIVVSAGQPYESAWLLTAKLQLTLPTARICVYMSRVSAVDVAASAFLGVDEPIESNGDVSRVAAQLLDQFSRA